jgi:hypothetical protein
MSLTMPLDAIAFDPGRPFCRPYRRVSTAAQTGGSGLDRQEHSRPDAEIAREIGLPLHPRPLVDDGVSSFRGANALKGQLARLLTDAQKGRLPRGTVIILDEWSRLTRTKPSKAQHLFSDLIHAGLGFYIKKSSQLINAAVIDGPNGTIILAFALLQLGIGHDESATKSRNVRFAKRGHQKTAIETGRPMTANTPGWLTTVGDKGDARRSFDFLPAPLYVIDRVFTEILRWGIWSITNWLNQDWLAGDEKCAPWGLKRRGGSAGWSVATVASLLHDRRLLGELTWTEVDEDGALVERVGETHVVYPVVPGMTEARWQAAQDAIAARRETYGGGRRGGRGGRRGDGFPNMLTSIVLCAVCDGPMVFKRHKPTGRQTVYHWLRCRSASDGTGCTQRSAITYLEVERRVLDACQGVLFEPGSLGQKPASTVADDIARITARLAFIAKRSSALLERDDIDEQEIAEKLAEWRGEKAQLSSELIAAQKLQRAEQNGTGAGDHVQAVLRLRAMATGVAEGEERTNARAELNAALRLIIDAVKVQPGSMAIWVGGGAKLAVFTRSSVRYCFFDYRGDWLWFGANGQQPPPDAADHSVLRAASLALAARFPERRKAFVRRFAA